MLKRILPTATAVALMLAAPAFAQTAGQPKGSADGPLTMPPAAVQSQAQAPVPAPATHDHGTILLAEKASQIRAEKLIGMKVVNGQGEELGTVDDIVINEDGTVSGLVLKTGGVLGIGGKFVAISWRDVGNAIGSKSVNLPMTKDQIEKAPAFKTKDEQSN